jgi:hypothetical protein
LLGLRSADPEVLRRLWDRELAPLDDSDRLEDAIEVLAVELDEQLTERHVLLPTVELCCDLEEQQLSGIAPVFDQTLEAGDVN